MQNPCRTLAFIFPHTTIEMIRHIFHFAYIIFPAEYTQIFTLFAACLPCCICTRVEEYSYLVILLNRQPTPSLQNTVSRQRAPAVTFCVISTVSPFYCGKVYAIPTYGKQQIRYSTRHLCARVTQTDYLNPVSSSTPRRHGNQSVCFQAAGGPGTSPSYGPHG